MTTRWNTWQCGLLLSFGLMVGFTGLASSAPWRAMPDTATMEFVRIEPGEFQMGCSPEAKPTECDADERPAHLVRITKAFEIAKTEVTQAQWVSLMGKNPSNFKGDNLPVEQVSWNDAQEFIQKLNTTNDGYRYRLPTEAEWEYAARAGTTDQYAGSLDEAWHRNNSGYITHPVAQKKPNAWGLFDMRGNVAEWVQDWHAKDYYANAPTNDPTGPSTGEHRVMRGGTFNGWAWLTRVSLRSPMEESYRFFDTGFRCVRQKR